MSTNLLFTSSMIMVAVVFLGLNGKAESLDITEAAQGAVKDIKGNSIEILDDSGSKVRIEINSNTVYDNVQKLTDLKLGDKVQIEYQEIHHKKIATTITKLEVEGEDSM